MTISPAERARQPDSRSVFLQDGATLAVVGGGPAGAFFAILAARKARALGKALDLVLIEKNSGGRDSCPAHIIEGCNYCAGGISPNLFDILNQNGIHLPEEIIEGKAESVIVHGDWKSLELPVPKGRTMLSVFRGTRPQNRPSRYENFDAFLLDQAVLTELKSKARKKRRLVSVLWKIAGGDDSYSKILWAMAQPAAIWTIFWGGALMTFRNALAERLFGLRWQGIGRYQTGVAMEDFEEKRQSFLRALEVSPLQRPEFASSGLVSSCTASWMASPEKGSSSSASIRSARTRVRFRSTSPSISHGGQTRSRGPSGGFSGYFFRVLSTT